MSEIEELKVKVAELERKIESSSFAGRAYNSVVIRWRKDIVCSSVGMARLVGGASRKRAIRNRYPRISLLPVCQVW